MANPFLDMVGYTGPDESGEVDTEPTGGNPFLDMVGYEAPEPEAAPTDVRGTGGFVNDLLMSWGTGSNALLEGVGTMYGLTTGHMDNWARRAGERGQEIFREGDVASGIKGLSTETRDAEFEREMALLEAEGFLDKAGTAVWETIKSPRLLSTAVANTLPMMVPGMGLGRGAGVTASALGASDKLARGAALLTTIGTMGVIQGADVASGHYNQLMSLPDEVWQKSPDFQQLVGQIGAEAAKDQIAVRSSIDVFALSTGISMGSNALPGGAVLEKVLSGAGSKMAGSLLARIAKGGLGEMTQEAVEEGGGQLVSNIAMQDIDPSVGTLEGVAEAGGMAAPIGFIFGAGAGAVTAPPTDEAPPEDDGPSEKIRSLSQNINAINEELERQRGADLRNAAEAARVEMAEREQAELEAALKMDEAREKPYPTYFHAAVAKSKLEKEVGPTGFEIVHGMDGQYYFIESEAEAALMRQQRNAAERAGRLAPEGEGVMEVEELPVEGVDYDTAFAAQGVEVAEEGELITRGVGYIPEGIEVEEVQPGEEIEMRKGPIYRRDDDDDGGPGDGGGPGGGTPSPDVGGPSEAGQEVQRSTDKRGNVTIVTADVSEEDVEGVNIGTTTYTATRDGRKVPTGGLQLTVDEFKEQFDIDEDYLEFLEDADAVTIRSEKTGGGRFSPVVDLTLMTDEGPRDLSAFVASRKGGGTPSPDIDGLSPEAAAALAELEKILPGEDRGKLMRAAQEQVGEVPRETPSAAQITEVTDDEFEDMLGEVSPEEVEQATEPVEPTGDAVETAGDWRTMRPEFEGTIFSFKPGDDRHGETMPHYYGEIAETEDADGMPIDVMLNKDYDGDADTPVFVVNQTDFEGNFRQHKVMAGFESAQDAEAAYIEAWGEEGFGGTVELTPEQFRQWRQDGDHKSPIEPPPEAAKFDITKYPAFLTEKWGDTRKEGNPEMWPQLEPVMYEPVENLSAVEQDVAKHKSMTYLNPEHQKMIMDVINEDRRILAAQGYKYWDLRGNPPRKDGEIFKQPESLWLPAERISTLGSMASFIDGMIGNIENDTIDTRNRKSNREFHREQAPQFAELVGISNPNEFFWEHYPDYAKEIQLERPEGQGIIARQKKAAEQARKNQQVSETDDLVTFIRKLGGLNVDMQSDIPEHRLAHLGADRSIGMPNLVQHGDKGLSLEQITEAMWEAGYIPDNDSRMAIDMLFEAEQTPQYTAKGYEAAMQREADAQLEAELDRQQEEWAEFARDNSEFNEVDPETARLMAEAGAIDHDAMVDIASMDAPEAEVQAALQAFIDERKGTETETAGAEEPAAETGRADEERPGPTEPGKPLEQVIEEWEQTPAGQAAIAESEKERAERERAYRAQQEEQGGPEWAQEEQEPFDYKPLDENNPQFQALSDKGKDEVRRIKAEMEDVYEKDPNSEYLQTLQYELEGVVQKELAPKDDGKTGIAALDEEGKERLSGQTVALIACCSTKGEARAPARDLYQSQLFKASLQYAEKIGADKVKVLSAEHGLLDIDDAVDPYDNTLKDKTKVERQNWARMVYNQLSGQYDIKGAQFVFLAGNEYRSDLGSLLSQHPDVDIAVPLEGLGIGEQLKRLKELNTEETAEDEYISDITPAQHLENIEDWMRERPSHATTIPAVRNEEGVDSKASIAQYEEALMEAGWTRIMDGKLATFIKGDFELFLSSQGTLAAPIIQWKSLEAFNLWDVLDRSRLPKVDTEKQLKDIKMEVTVGDETIKTTAEKLVNAYDDRIEALAKLLDCV